MRNRRLLRDADGWRTLGRKILFENAYLQVCEERVKPPSRQRAMSWTVAHRKSAAVVAPRTAHGGYVLVRQERIPARRTFWEFPAGQIDEAFSPVDAHIRETALRELHEESGWQLARRGRLRPLGMFYTSPGFTSEHAWLYLASPVEPSPGGALHDAGETIVEARVFSATALRRMIGSGEICDANTLAAFARLAAKRVL